MPAFTKLFTRACAALLLANLATLTSASQLSDPTSAPSQPSEREAFGKLYHCKPGPWGELEYYYVYLEAPERVVDMMLRPAPTPKWCFPGASDSKLRTLFETARLPGSLQEYLLAPLHRVTENDVTTLFPPLPDLMAMTQEQRSIIYTELAKSELNVLHVYPACIYDGDLEAWFAASDLRPALRDAIAKLTYKRGDMLCFSDVGAILGMVESEKEAQEFMKTMSRTRSIMLHLNVKTRSDFEEAMHYWSADGHNKEVSSLIFPAMDIEQVQKLDCVNLLPSLARRYLHTYPSEELVISASMPDCNWTALNFFSSSPLNYHTDDRFFGLHLTEDYDAVQPPYRFGDVLMFVRPDGTPHHSCVYIADDIVYTKNGRNRVAPWLLNKIDEVRNRYSTEHELILQGYRLKLPQDEDE